MENNAVVTEVVEEVAEKKEKKYVNPVLSWCLFAGALVVAAAVALIVLLPLA